MKKTGKYLAVLLAAVSASTTVSATSVSPINAPVSTTSPGIVSEEVALREQSVKHFLLSDGSYTAVVYGEPVHYRKGNEWVEIDNSLVSASLVGEPHTGAIKRDTELTVNEKQTIAQYEQNSNHPYNTAYYENNANDFKVQFPKGINSNTPVAVSYAGHSLRFCFDDTANVSAKLIQPINAAENAQLLQKQLTGVTDNEIRAKIQNKHAMAVQKNRSSVSYASVQTNIDLNYSLNGQRLKEDLVFHALPVSKTFSFSFIYTGLQAVLEEDNSVTFYDEAGKSVFVIASPFMFDSGEGYSTDISVTLEQTNTGCRYILTPDREWLEDEKRVYPVTLDPPIDTTQNTNYIHDNGVQQSDPNTNYMTTNRMYVGSGSNSKEGRIYFKLTQWPSATGLNSGTITGAYMDLNYYPTASYQTGYNMNVDVYRVASSWDTSTIKWNNQPGVTGGCVGSLKIEDSRGKTSGEDVYNVTSWVKAHYASPSTDYGIRFQPRTVASSTNRVCYISSDYYGDTTLRPIIHINYASGSGQASGITSNQIYYLRNVNSGKYLEAPGINNGTDLVQNTFNSDSPQQFKVVYNSSTSDYALIPMRDTGAAIEITNQSSANDAIVQIWDKPSSGYMNSQRFNIVKNLSLIHI